MPREGPSCPSQSTEREAGDPLPEACLPHVQQIGSLHQHHCSLYGRPMTCPTPCPALERSPHFIKVSSDMYTALSSYHHFRWGNRLSERLSPPPPKICTTLIQTCLLSHCPSRHPHTGSSRQFHLPRCHSHGKEHTLLSSRQRLSTQLASMGDIYDIAHSLLLSFPVPFVYISNGTAFTLFKERGGSGVEWILQKWNLKVSEIFIETGGSEDWSHACHL